MMNKKICISNIFLASNVLETLEKNNSTLNYFIKLHSHGEWGYANKVQNDQELDKKGLVQSLFLINLETISIVTNTRTGFSSVDIISE